MAGSEDTGLAKRAWQKRHTHIHTHTHIHMFLQDTHGTSLHGGACPRTRKDVNLCTQTHTSHTCGLLHRETLLKKMLAGQH